MTQFSEKLEEIIKNKKLGSSELVFRLNDLLRTFQHNHKLIEKTLPEIKKELNHFSAVAYYIDQLKSVISLKGKKGLKKFLEHYSEDERKKYQKIFSKLYKQIPHAKQIITLSRSGTILNILRRWQEKDKSLRVIICESRPKFEGRSLAVDLLKSGLKVEIIADSAISLFVPKIDAAIIGADNVLKNGNVINKTGSKALALICREHKKPFYVVTTRSKVSKLKKFKTSKEDPAEIWTKTHKNLRVNNIYFEEIESKFITALITD